ncbi:hypothetical protein [Teichococcus vastitatis]|jgi:hypothetical protein|uniref:Uncharacterized protein n=1 Tax=Teichococcus vastitatis TaxID=2307076 RepID=A0ABS9W8S7_9PROT|nr:hypothetical protein [Pseudoroseomonas vastitatis]MCI0755707.1 hypothetical protein [Pseudoroseomonas vastitatis]
MTDQAGDTRAQTLELMEAFAPQMRAVGMRVLIQYPTADDAHATLHIEPATAETAEILDEMRASGALALFEGPQDKRD